MGKDAATPLPGMRRVELEAGAALSAAESARIAARKRRRSPILVNGALWGREPRPCGFGQGER